MYDIRVIKGFPFLPLLCAGGDIHFTINMPRIDAEIPRQNGRRWMFERARPSLATIALPRLSVPIFKWTVCLRVMFKFVCDTSNSIPDPPAISQSIYRLSYPAHGDNEVEPQITTLKAAPNKPAFHSDICIHKCGPGACP